MQLHGIMPKTKVDGFIAELIRHQEPVFQNEHKLPLIDYCYEVSITCDGSNPQYTRKGRALFLVTQFSNDQYQSLITGDEYLPIIILDHHEVLEAINVVEAKSKMPHQVLVTFNVFNIHSKRRRTLAWAVRKSEKCALH